MQTKRTTILYERLNFETHQALKEHLSTYLLSYPHVNIYVQMYEIFGLKSDNAGGNVSII